MLVAIPFHAGDWILHKKNLDLCLLLEGGVSKADGIDGACLFWDQLTPPNAVEEIRERAKRYFPHVEEKQLNIPEAIKGWPWAPNNMFQKALFHMESFSKGTNKYPWFWWEADATPLRPRWLTDLAAEYKKGGKPFMGHIVEGMGHFNGVAVYPHNMRFIAPSVLAANQHTAWDVYIHAQDLRKYGDKPVHKANHLMQHVWSVDKNGNPTNGEGVPAHFDNWQQVAEGPWRADFTGSFYHRCKDGSLADQIIAHNFSRDKVVPDHKPFGETSVAEITTSQPVGVTIPVQPVKRKRGRPRKNPPPEAPVIKFTGKCEILIVTHQKDYDFLWYCLHGIRKNLTGHSGVTLAVPKGQEGGLAQFKDIMPFTVYAYDEIPGKGMIQHEERICTADHICPNADFILHMDADVIMHSPHTIDDYFINNRPVYVWRPWESLKGEENGQKVVSDCHQWKKYVDRDLGCDTIPYTMCRHTSTFPRWFYPYFRAAVQKATGKNFREHVLEQKSSFPQTFAEFPALGAYAWHNWQQHWHWIDASKGPVPREHFKAYWSHARLDGVEIPGSPIPRREMEDKFKLPPYAG